MATKKTILNEVLQLKPAEKYIVIETLIKSLDNPDSDLDTIWLNEAEKRLTLYKAGKLKTTSFEKVFKK